MIRVVLADDQQLIRAGLRVLLETEDGFAVVGEAADGAQAVALARETRPDVVVMDVRMPGVDGLTALDTIVADPALAGTAVLVLTTFDLDEYVYAAIRAGASGFLLKDVQPADLVAAIRVVAAGNSLFAPAATQRLLERFAGSGPAPSRTLDSLTEREREILALIASGLSNAELATRLHLSETTVKTHVSSVLRKLGVRDRVQAVIAAYDAGLVRPGG